MKWVYSLFFTSALAFSLGVLFGFSGLFIQASTDGNVFMGAAGFLLASAGWLFNNAINLRMRIRDQTLKYLRLSEKGIRQARRLNRLWIEYRLDYIINHYDEKIDFFNSNALSHELFICMNEMANAYEELAISIKAGAVEDLMLRRSYATDLKWFWSRLQPFLSLYRNQSPTPGSPYGSDPNPKVFSHCEALANKWHGREL